MKDIGSIYPIYTLDVPEGSSGPLPFDHEPNVRYFSLCREALSAIARTIDKPHRTVLIPAYTCQTVITPFVELGFDCRYYGVTEELRIDTESLKALFAEVNPDVVVVHPYYGCDLNEHELCCLRNLRNDRCVFIEDLTQCLFSTLRDETFDYYVGSMRKWFPIPDGAFAFSPRHKIPLPENLEENTPFVTSMLDAMFLRGLYYSSGDVRVKDISRRIDKHAVANAASHVAPHALSAYSRAVLPTVDCVALQLRRRQNYLFLHEHLKTDFLTLARPDVSEVTTTPLYFPVYAKDRAAIIRQLIPHRIYAPVLWPVKTESVVINDVTRMIYDHILALPCDQRYDENDLQRIAEVL